jgi:hypothetical protein
MENDMIIALHNKIFHGNPSVAEVKSDLQKISNLGRRKWEDSPLGAAVRSHRQDLIKLMVNDFGVDLDSEGGLGTALAYAIRFSNGKTDMIKFLVVEMKANVENDRSNSLPALHRAVAFKHLSIVKCFVEELGAGINCKGSYQKGDEPFLALHMAIYMEIKDVLEYVLLNFVGKVRLAINSPICQHIGQTNQSRTNTRER